MSNHREDYASRLRLISENAFQREMEILLSANIVDFQPVPARPKGDGGLDGLSNGNTHAFCCYGLDLVSGKVKPDQIKKKILNKFTKDLKRLCEVHRSKSGVCSHKKNKELATINPGRKIVHITLLTNWMEDHAMIGDIQSEFDSLKANSQCNFVDAKCSIIILGPKQLITRYHIEHEAVLRLQYPGLIETIESAKSQPVMAQTDRDSEFDKKFDYLIVIRPSKRSILDEMREKTRQDWLQGMGLMKDLQDNHPDIYLKVEGVRQKIGKVAELENQANDTGSVTEMIRKYHEILQTELSQTLPQGFTAEHISEIANYSLSWLIGACPLDWRPDGQK